VELIFGILENTQVNSRIGLENKEIITKNLPNLSTEEEHEAKRFLRYRIQNPQREIYKIRVERI
jgi:hypothetical protein